MNRYLKTLSREQRRKKEVRDFLFSLFLDMQLNNIVGLAGPNIKDYIEFCKSKGFTEFEIYEKDGLTAMHQLIHLKDEGIQLNLKDIIHAIPNKPSTLYDLDFCATVRYLKHHIAKFNAPFIMTFCERIAREETISTFFDVRNETVIEERINTHPLKHIEYITEKGRYIFASYRDATPMCCFAKVS